MNRRRIKMLAGAIFVALAGSAATSVTVEIKGIKYESTSDSTCVASLTDSFFKKYQWEGNMDVKICDEVEIEGKTYKTTELGDFKGMNRNQVTKNRLILPDAIETFNSYFLQGSRIDFTWPKNIKTLETACFYQYSRVNSDEPLLLPEGIEKIGGAINEWGLPIYYIPSTVKEISGNAIYYGVRHTGTFLGTRVRELTCAAVTPPKIIHTSYDSNFITYMCVVDMDHNHVEYEKDPLPFDQEITLYVPAESVELYKSTPVWNGFKEILPIAEDEVKINSVRYKISGENTCTAYGTDDGWYDLYGDRSNREVLNILPSVEIGGRTYFTTEVDNLINIDNYKYKNNGVTVKQINLPDGITTFKSNFLNGSAVLINWPKGLKKLESESLRGFSTHYEYLYFSNRRLPEGIEYLGKYLNLDGDPVCDTIPSTVREMEIPCIEFLTSYLDGHFFKDLKCLALAPPRLIYDQAKEMPNIIFSSEKANPDSEINLYVPAKSVELYKSTPGWNRFKNILPLTEDAGIEEVASPTQDVTFEIGNGEVAVKGCDAILTIYAPDGRIVDRSDSGRVTGLPAGLYIASCGTHRAKIAIR